MRKKITAIVLIITLFSTLLFGCSSKETTENTSKVSECEDSKISLRFSRLGWTDVRPPAEEIWMWKRYEEKTGIHINWEEIPRDGFEERKNIMMAANDLPDAFYQLPFSNEEIGKYGSTGLFVPLNDLIEKNGENIKKMWEEEPAIKKGLTMPDGNIYSLPYIVTDTLETCFKNYINVNWLENLNLEMPNTVDELTEVLKEFKSKDANGNGDNEDEVPIYLPTGMFELLESSLLGSYGLGNRGFQGAEIWIDVKDNDKLRFIPTDDRYKEILELMHEWWDLGLFHPETFSGIDYARWAADGAEDTVGFWIWNSPNYIGQKIANNYYGNPVFKGPHGDQIYSNVKPKLCDAFAFILTNANKYLEESIEWVDYFYSEEGSIFGYYGEEGVTYNLDEEGNPKYIDEIINYEGGPQLGAFQWLDNVYGGMYPYKEMPMDKISAMNKNVEDYLRIDTESYKEYMPEEILSKFTATNEEYSELSALTTDISTLIEEMRVKFITGELNFDKDWDNYVNTLKKIGSDRYLEIRQQQYDRYKNN